MTTIRVRPATPDDAGEIVAITRASITELCVLDHRHDEPTLERWLRNKTVESVLGWLAAESGYIVVAEANGVACGVGGLKRGGLITLLYVRPGYQGLGVGRALLLEVEAQAKHWGETELTLTSTTKARAFYERHGYVASGAAQYKYGVLSDYPYVKVVRG